MCENEKDILAEDAKCVGDVFTFNEDGVVITDPQGYISKIIDITPENGNFQAFFNTAKTAMILVNADSKIIKINSGWKDIMYIDEISLPGKRFGDGFKCIESLLYGCGKGQNCIICTVSNSIRKVLKNRLPIYNVTIKYEFVSNEKGISPTLNTSYFPVAIQGEKCVLITAEDISDCIACNESI